MEKQFNHQHSLLKIISAIFIVSFLVHPLAQADTDLEAGFPVKMYNGGGTYRGGPGVNIVVDNLDNDNHLEILLSGKSSGPVYAFNSDASIVNGWPIIDSAFSLGYPSAGKLLPGSNYNQPFIGFHSGELKATDSDGSNLTGWPANSSNYITSPAMLVDIDNDGVDEIFIGEEDFKLHGYRADGSVLPGWPVRTVVGGQSRFTPAAADLDNDGDIEIITVTGSNSAGVGILAYHHDGTEVSGFPVVLESGISVTYPSIGDVDGDGQNEIIMVSREAAYPYTRILNILSADGQIESQYALASNITYSAAPTLADLDGDLIPEIILQTDISIVVMKSDGSNYPGWPQVIAGIYTNSTPVVGDVDGDGQPDIVVFRRLQNINKLDSVYVFNRNGLLHPRFPKELSLGDGYAPAIADIDMDGRNEIIIAGHKWDGFADNYDSLWVYDLGGPSHGPIQWGQFAGGPKHQGRYRSPVTVAVPVADVSVQLSGDKDVVAIGNTIKISTTVTNKSTVTAEKVVVAIRLPVSGIEFSSSTSCTVVNTVAYCNVGDIAAGLSAIAEMDLTATALVSPTLRGILSSKTSDPDLTDNIVTYSFSTKEAEIIPPEPPVADISVSISASTKVPKVRQTFAYTLRVNNNGPEDAGNLFVTVSLPTTVIIVSWPEYCVKGTSNLVCTIDGLLVNQENAFDIEVSPTISKVTLNTVTTVDGDINDEDLTNNTASHTMIVKGK